MATGDTAPSATTNQAPRFAIPLDSARGRWVIIATALGSGMIFLDSSVVNVALPRIQTDLAAPLSGLQWVVNAYTLFLAALLLVGGDLGDVYGRKLMFLVGLAVFTAASVACGLAPNLVTLIAARAAQGVGGALLVPGSLAMIRVIIAPEDSARAIGQWAGLSGVAVALGPLVGGYLVTALTWRAIFFINVPLSLLTAYAIAVHVPPNRDVNASRDLDWLGAATTVVGLGGVTFGLIEGPQAGWDSPGIAVSLVIGALALILFPIREMFATNPMVPLSVFRSRNFTGSNIATLGVYFALYGALLFLVLNMQQIQGYSPLEAGLATLPFTIVLLVLSPRVGALTTRTGMRLPMVVGPAMVAVGYLYLMRAGSHTSYLVDFLPAILLISVGMSIFITPLTTTVMASVPENRVGVASGTNNAISRVAGLLAVAVLGIIIAWRFDSSLSGRLHRLGVAPPARSALLAHEDRLADDPVPASLTGLQRRAVHHAIDDAYVDGFRWEMGVCALLCALSALVCAGTIRIGGTSQEPAAAGR